MFSTESPLKELPTFPNIGHMSSGYDVFHGNPHATSGIDPGLRGGRIFNFTYNHLQTTLDRRHLIPDGMHILSTPSCAFDFETTMVGGETSYRNSLEVSAKVSGGGWGSHFAASSDYKRVKKGSTVEKKVYTSSVARCTAYTAFTRDFTTLTLDRFFREDIRNLPVLDYTINYISFNETNAGYQRILRLYGTHVITHVVMGGRYGILSEMNKDKKEELERKGIKVDVAAGYSGIVEVSASAVTDKEREDAHVFEQNRLSKRTFQVGGKPSADSDGNPSPWAATVAEDPVPLSYELHPLSHLLTASNFPHEPFIEQKRIVLEANIVNYCNKLDIGDCKRTE